MNVPLMEEHMKLRSYAVSSVTGPRPAADPSSPGYYKNIGYITAAASPDEAVEKCAQACGFESANAMREHDRGVHVAELPPPVSVVQVLELFDYEDADPEYARELAEALCIAAWDDDTPPELVPVKIGSAVYHLCEGRYRDGDDDPYWVDFFDYEDMDERDGLPGT